MNKVLKTELVQKRITELGMHVVKMQQMLKKMEQELKDLNQELLSNEEHCSTSTIDLELLAEFKQELKIEFEQASLALSESRFDDCKEKLVQALGTAQMLELHNFSANITKLVEEVMAKNKNEASVLLAELIKEIPILGNQNIKQNNKLDQKLDEDTAFKERVLDQLQYEFLEELRKDLNNFLLHCKNKNALPVKNLSNQHIGNAMLLQFSTCTKQLQALETAAKSEAYNDMEKITFNLIEHISNILVS